MANAPVRPCSQMGCPEYAEPRSSRCADHPREAWPDKDRERRSHYTREARRAMNQYRRTHILCEQCGAPATDIDHIINLASGGAPADPANLQALCKACHQRKTSAEAHAARRKQRPVNLYP